MPNPYPKEFAEKLVQDAIRIGTCAAARINKVSPQTIITYCHKVGISLKRKATKKACIICGKEFAYRPGKKRICCSRQCREKYDTKILNCLHCGTAFKVIRSKVQKYCSHICYSQSNRQDNLPRKRRGSNWNTIRRRFKRNPCLCQMCDKEMATDLHHIMPYKYFNGDFERANHASNLVALCKSCHRRAERRVKHQIAIVEAFQNA